MVEVQRGSARGHAASLVPRTTRSLTLAHGQTIIRPMKLLALLPVFALAFTSVACGDDDKPAVDAAADVAGDVAGEGGDDAAVDSAGETATDSSGEASVG